MSIKMTDKGYVETFPRVKRYIGDAVIEIEHYEIGSNGGEPLSNRDQRAFDGRWYYRGKITVIGTPRDQTKPPVTWEFDGLGSGVGGIRDAGGCDSPEAYDHMAESAVGFGGHVASAIREATEWDGHDSGGLMVRRSINGVRRGPYGG